MRQPLNVCKAALEFYLPLVEIPDTRNPFIEDRVRVFSKFMASRRHARHA